MSISLSAARAAASRRNGARSRGPKTPEGKARSAKNALKHGLCAKQPVLLDDEDARAFAALAGALADDLAPQGALQGVLARRLVVAAWRLERADRIENELFALQAERSERGWGRLALALVRDGNGTRSFDTLLRYCGSAMAELWRALRALKALQAEAAAGAIAMPNEPEGRRHPRLAEQARPPERDLPEEHQPPARDPQADAPPDRAGNCLEDEADHHSREDRRPDERDCGLLYDGAQNHHDGAQNHRDRRHHEEHAQGQVEPGPQRLHDAVGADAVDAPEAHCAQHSEKIPMMSIPEVGRSRAVTIGATAKPNEPETPWDSMG